MENSPDPYGHMHIYHLEGRLSPGSFSKEASFIGNWEEDGHSFLFFKSASLPKVMALINQRPHLKLLDAFRMSYAEWHGEPVRPFRVGKLRIVPPWLKKPADAADGDEKTESRQSTPVEILLDPGVVFGTGTHPTTRHCLEAIQILTAGTTLDTVVDIGTGTGLLAIAAVKLGCNRALAVDLNCLATATAANNVQLNGLGNRILAVQGSAENFVDLPSDLVISNIHYDVMRKLIGPEHYPPTRYMILSGLLRSQAAIVENLLKQTSMKVLEKWEDRTTWYSYLAKVPRRLVDRPAT